eukprot:scaffold2.g7055.t1
MTLHCTSQVDRLVGAADRPMVLPDLISQPIAAIRALYAQQDHGRGSKLDVRPVFAPLGPQQVPVLTEASADALPNQSLVRYRGMVADMLNPEYFVGEYRRADGSWQTAKYQDQLDEPLGGPATAPGADDGQLLAERRPVLLVPVPGEASWVKAAHEAAGPPVAAAAAAQAGGGPGGAKRGRDGEQLAQDDAVSVSMLVSDATGMTGGDAADTAATRARTEGQQQEASSGAGAAPATGVDDIPAGAVMAYLYDDEEVKLNDVVDVVGVVSKVPELAAAHMQGGAAQGQARWPSAGRGAWLLLSRSAAAPRLHAILLRPAASPHPAHLPALPSGAALGEARGRAIGFLSQVLGGDDLAAEYLLLQLVGRVHLRSREAGPVGLMALNLAGAPAAPAPGGGGLSPLGGALAAALAALAPRVVSLPLSVDKLNARPWWPRRDQGSQRLISGPLQVAGATQLLLDESILAAGTLREVGLRNLAALATLARTQTVGYDFEFFSLDQPTDCPVTVLSTSRSLLKDSVQVVVPLRPTAPLADAASVSADADLAPVRAYLAAARELAFSIDASTATFLENELAAARQKDPELTQQSLHTWMNLARLDSISHGEGSLTPQRWQQALALDAARRERLRAAQPAGARA